MYGESVIEIETRVLAMKNYPCMDCHTVKEKLDNIAQLTFPLHQPHNQLSFKHMNGVKNCYTCHVQDNLNELQLMNKSKVSFDESYKVCFQCHGEKKRDWSLGIHGRQIGSAPGKEN